MSSGTCPPVPLLAALVAVSVSLAGSPLLAATAAPPVPPDQRGSVANERTGMLDAGTIRTVFQNFGMIGDYPSDPVNVDLSVFHSVEAPKGSGMNYSDGITPFLLARVTPTAGETLYVMETGYRERQQTSPNSGQVMRLEPRPGYFQSDPALNPTQSPAISDDPRTWPPFWPDRLGDPTDPGWAGLWDGRFGKGISADQESYTVTDDQAYDAWPQLVPDARDPTRRGLALRFDVRTVQWTQAGTRDVLFVCYDVTNEGTTRYDHNLIFGLYSDAGVGSSKLSCDGIYESDDDNAYWERTATYDVGYAWDRYGHGVDLSGACATTGYNGWSFLETPGDPDNGVDDDRDGITDERQDDGPGLLIVGAQAIRDYFVAHRDTALFRARYGPLEQRPAYAAGWWWTGDEDLDWTIADDVGADGVPGTHDVGEGDQIPDDGEPDFGRADPHESDQLGLAGFKMIRIGAGPGFPEPHLDGILFYMDEQKWPQQIWDHFTNPDEAARFDTAVAYPYNVAYLIASGPFTLDVGQRVRFSMALAYAPTLPGLRQAVADAQSLHDTGYQPALVNVPERNGTPPGTSHLLGNVPNPLTHTTRIRFTLAETRRVRLDIFDVQGRLLVGRRAGTFNAGESHVVFDATGLSPGLYLYRLLLEDPLGRSPASILRGRMVVIE
jgi:hypothetical protein